MQGGDIHGVDDGDKVSSTVMLFDLELGLSKASKRPVHPEQGIAVMQRASMAETRQARSSLLLVGVGLSLEEVKKVC